MIFASQDIHAWEVVDALIVLHLGHSIGCDASIQPDYVPVFLLITTQFHLKPSLTNPPHCFITSVCDIENELRRRFCLLGLLFRALIHPFFLLFGEYLLYLRRVITRILTLEWINVVILCSYFFLFLFSIEGISLRVAKTSFTRGGATAGGHLYGEFLRVWVLSLREGGSWIGSEELLCRLGDFFKL